MATPKVMLDALLTRGKLDPKEREAMGSMWDSLHRYGRLSRKQGAWIEKLYYAHQLDKAPPATPKVASINYAGIEAMMEVTSMAQLAQVCPKIEKGSDQHAKIAKFFKNGGTLLKVKPAP